MTPAAREWEVEPESGGGPQSASTWPHEADREPLYAIGQVVKMLQSQFPATTVSKIRFLEDKGLVTPHRTASGYRKYSQSDVERIRFVLVQQRDSYAPLKVIGEQLEALDAGFNVEPLQGPQLIATQEVLPVDKRQLTVRELADLTGVTREELEQYVKLGLISPTLGGKFSAATVGVVSSIGELIASGIPARNLRSVKSGSERSADLIDQVLLSSMRRDRPGDQERRQARAQELAKQLADLHASLLQVAIESLEH